MNLLTIIVEKLRQEDEINSKNKLRSTHKKEKKML